MFDNFLVPLQSFLLFRNDCTRPYKSTPAVLLSFEIHFERTYQFIILFIRRCNLFVPFPTFDAPFVRWLASIKELTAVNGQMPQIPVHSNIKKSKSFDFASHNGQIKVLSGENRNNYISVPCSAETIKWNE